MKREIRPHSAVVESIAADNITDAKQWLQTQATTHGLLWLLAHADDGVIWGRMDNGQLITLHDVVQNDNEAKKVCPPLRIETLQQARLFAEHGELLLWCDGDNIWHARLLRDARTNETPLFAEAFDEPQILWGTDPRPLNNNFTLMSDGAQGLRHAVPLAVNGTFDERTRPLRLWVRHYIGENASGFTRVVASRLYELKLERAR